jgi:hypothetical protein
MSIVRDHDETVETALSSAPRGANGVLMAAVVQKAMDAKPFAGQRLQQRLGPSEVNVDWEGHGAAASVCWAWSSVAC